MQRVQIGEQFLFAAVMILMKDRDATLDTLSKGVTIETTLEVINFTAARSRNKTMKRIAALKKEGFELLAVVLPDKSCKYSLGNPQHLPLAEELVSNVEKKRATAYEDQGAGSMSVIEQHVARVDVAVPPKTPSPPTQPPGAGIPNFQFPRTPFHRTWK
jgi:hypothetical protein